MVELKGVSLSYAHKHKREAAALGQVNARFERGNFTAVIGPSGINQDGRKKVKALLEEFGLDAFSDHYPQQLSGGMRQCLAIVRALVCEPELLLMDEPFSSLDALTRESAQDFILSVQRSRRLTVIMVTHSIEEAVYLADTIYVMNGVNPVSITGCVAISRNGDSPRERFREVPQFQEYCGILRRDYLRKSVITADGNGADS